MGNVNILIFLGIILLLLGIVLFVILAYRSCIKKEWRRLGRLFGEMRGIFANARKGEITKSDVDKFFDCADKALDMMSKKIFKSNKEDIPSLKDEIDKMSSQISSLLAVRTPGKEIEKLAVMRKNGMISDLEFQAFSERFKLSTGEKASGIIKAISELSRQYQQGAILESNYHAALWALLDKLDRKI
jgi:hypothetical protein